MGKPGRRARRAGQQGARRIAEVGSGGPQAKILVVDDSELAARLLVNLLTRAGHHVRVADSGEAALAQMDQERPDLVITDLLMPGTDGYELCRQIRSRPTLRSVPVVALTQADELQAKLRGFEAGVDDYVVKDAPHEELLARVQVLLRRGARDEAPPAPAPARRRGQVALFFSLKGGAGVSTLVANLAIRLARQYAERVAVLDLALEQGTQDILLDVPPRVDLGRLAEDEVSPAALTPHEIQRLVAMHAAGVALLAAPAQPEGAERVTTDLSAAALEALAGAFDMVLVDTPSHYSEHVLRALELADVAVVVGTPDLAGARALGTALRVFRDLRLADDQLLCVLNAVSPDVGITRESIELAMKIRVDQAIPYDGAFQAALNNGKPLTLAEEKRPRPSVVALGELGKVLTARLNAVTGR